MPLLLAQMVRAALLMADLVRSRCQGRRLHLLGSAYQAGGNGLWRPDRRIGLALFLYMIAPFAAQAQVPDIPNVPDDIPSAARAPLLIKRDQFVARRSAFIGKATAHNAQCKQVPLNTPEAAFCDVARGRLKGELTNLQMTADALSAAIRGTGGLSAPIAVAPNRSFVIERVEFRGEFYVTTSDDRHLSGQNAAQVSIDNGAHLMTGPSGHAVIHLPDDTSWTIGPNSNVIIDTFLYDPETHYSTIAAEMVVGMLHWVTGNIEPSRATKLLDPSGRVRMIDPTKPDWYKGLTPGEREFIMPVMSVGLRGTDFEVEVKPDGSSLLKLHSGLVDVTPRSGGNTVTLSPGQMISIGAAGKILGPQRIQ